MQALQINLDLDYAYSHCREVAKSHYENFPVGSLLIPGNKRKYIYSIYAFARHADDIADSNKLGAEEKLKKLNELDDELIKIQYHNTEDLLKETKNIFIALSDTIEELKIPIGEFRNLLIAFRQDSVKQRYEEFEELITYSDFSANPIGHLVLDVFGYTRDSDEKCFGYSDKICTALQLTNFWQDVSLDLKMNRIYIPAKSMKEFDYSEQMLFENIENDNFRSMIKNLVDKTKMFYEDGEGIINLVRGRLKLELKATLEGGMEILKKIERINYNVLSRRVTIDSIDKLKLLGRIFWK
ncbi:MAG: squalene synthase HpnC [Bacteroidota bacterium]|nr:squalene synthase HpnC [Bacteroidota bacterium]